MLAYFADLVKILEIYFFNPFFKNERSGLLVLVGIKAAQCLVQKISETNEFSGQAKVDGWK